jgi:hypothetical protein
VPGGCVYAAGRRGPSAWRRLMAPERSRARLTAQTRANQTTTPSGPTKVVTPAARRGTPMMAAIGHAMSYAMTQCDGSRRRGGAPRPATPRLACSALTSRRHAMAQRMRAMIPRVHFRPGARHAATRPLSLPDRSLPHVPGGELTAGTAKDQFIIRPRLARPRWHSGSRNVPMRAVITDSHREGAAHLRRVMPTARSRPSQRLNPVQHRHRHGAPGPHRGGHRPEPLR